MAGIRIFATGGIGGVHRGAELNFDISADLTEMGRTPVAVVSAGAKAILDIPKTLEVLETQGVNVLGYKTKELPAFYTRKSGCEVNVCIEDDLDAARIVKSHFDDLKLQSGLLIANPIPEDEEANNSKINLAIETALKEAE